MLIYLASSGASVIGDVHLEMWLIIEPSAYIAVVKIIMIVATAQLEAFIPPQNRTVIQFGLLWVFLSVSLNVIVTLMICFRLLRMRALTREALSPEMSSIYTSIATMLIESAAPFSILGICLIITGALNEPFDAAFSLVWGIICVESSPLPSPSFSFFVYDERKI